MKKLLSSLFVICLFGGVAFSSATPVLANGFSQQDVMAEQEAMRQRWENSQNDDSDSTPTTYESIVGVMPFLVLGFIAIGVFNAFNGRTEANAKKTEARVEERKIDIASELIHNGEFDINELSDTAKNALIANLLGAKCSFNSNNNPATPSSPAAEEDKSCLDGGFDSLLHQLELQLEEQKKQKNMQQ